MTTPQTLTELLSKVDWSQMETDIVYFVRHSRDRTCPIVAALGYSRSEQNAVALGLAMSAGFDQKTVVAAIDAADCNPSWGPETPAIARWRQYFLEQIHASQTEQL